MSWIKRVLYGILVGVASIAPGISGGTIAIALGFYESLINAVADLLKHFKKNFLYLLPYGVGALFSMAALSVVINFFFTRFSLPTSCLFIGFILGTLPFVRSKLKGSLSGSALKASHIVTLAVFFLIVLIPLFLKEDGGGSAMLSREPGSIILLVGVGVIVAATLIVPGLSGTMILTAMGYYKPLLLIASTFVTALASFQISDALDLLIFIIPLGIGVLIGGFVLAKAVSFLFRVIPSHVYAAITGLILATPIVMLADIKSSDVSAATVICGILALAAGLILTRFLGDEA